MQNVMLISYIGGFNEQHSLAAGNAGGQNINMKKLQREDRTKVDSSFANTSAWPRDLEMDIHPKKCRILIAAANQKAKESKKEKEWSYSAQKLSEYFLQY